MNRGAINQDIEDTTVELIRDAMMEGETKVTIPSGLFLARHKSLFVHEPIDRMMCGARRMDVDFECDKFKENLFCSWDENNHFMKIFYYGIEEE